MKTTDAVFTDYLNKTAWTPEAAVPSHSELVQLEQNFMAKLGEVKGMKPQDGSYRYLYSVFGKQVVSRIGFLVRKKDEGDITPLVNILLSSATRLREAMKSLDPKLYQVELKPTINRYHRERMKRLKEQVAKDDEIARSKKHAEQPQPSTSTQTPVEFPRVLSSTQGLADFLGCGRTMAFSIIKSGVLKADAIQYKVGQCWKFNREKLEKYLADNPELLGRIRCKRPKNG